MYICIIDQACSVKLAGYWPSNFFFFFYVFMDRGEVVVNNNAKGTRYSAILTEQAWLIKDILYGEKENFF